MRSIVLPLAIGLLTAACEGSFTGSTRTDVGLYDTRADAARPAADATIPDGGIPSDVARSPGDASLRSDAPIDARACSCAGRACGDDGCGGSCGTCGVGSTCTDFMCVPTGEVATRFSLPPWPIAGVSLANCQRFHSGDYVGIVNGGPVFARIHAGILWGESYEGMGTEGPFTAARFPVGAGQFKPSHWVSSSSGLTATDRWCFADDDPRSGWTPETIRYRPFSAGALLTREDGAVHLVNGGPIWARRTGTMLWAEAYEGEGRTPPYTAERYPAGTGQFKPGHWLSASGFDWRQASQFSETMP